MTITRAAIYSLIACFISVALEGIFAGGGIKQRLAELKTPAYALPLWGWMIIGLLYYAMCFAVLSRLLAAPAISLRNIALAILGSMMLINAAWNYFFFRSRNLFHALMIGLPYTVFAVVLLFLLVRIDRTAAWCLFPYLFYLCYASLFSYRVWKMNG